MKVILKEDVDKLGLRGQIVKVADGFGRNYLIPRGIAIKITPANMVLVEHERKALEARRMKEMEAAHGVKSRVETLELVFRRKVGDSETLYGSVTNADIAEALIEQGVEVDKRKIELAEPIKSLGNYSVPVKLHRDVQALIKVYVVQEES